MLDIYKNKNEDDEVRIAALIALSKCATNEVIRQVLDVYESETSKQGINTFLKTQHPDWWHIYYLFENCMLLKLNEYCIKRIGIIKLLKNSENKHLLEIKYFNK